MAPGKLRELLSPSAYQALKVERLRARANRQDARPNVLADPRYRTFQTKYRRDPVGFVHDCIEWRRGEAPAPYQDEVLVALTQHPRVSVRGPHGLGKTSL